MEQRRRNGQPGRLGGGVAVNADRKRWSREADAPVAVGEADNVMDDHSGAVTTSVVLRAALGRLTKRQRAAIVLRYFADLPVADIAAGIGVCGGDGASDPSPGARGLANRRWRRCRRMNVNELSDELVWLAGDTEVATNDGLCDVHQRAQRQRRLRFAAVASAIVGVVGIAVIVTFALGGGSTTNAPRIRPATPEPSTTPTTLGGNALGRQIYGSGKVNVAGPNGIAGWVYTSDLNYPTTAEDFKDIDALNQKLRNWAAPVHDDNGNVIGYWVTNNVGFVDLATYNSPDYDPDALRAARLGPDGVEWLERLQSDFDACLDTHTVPECAAQAGG